MMVMIVNDFEKIWKLYCFEETIFFLSPGRPY